MQQTLLASRQCSGWCAPLQAHPVSPGGRTFARPAASNTGHAQFCQRSQHTAWLAQRRITAVALQRTVAAQDAVPESGIASSAMPEPQHNPTSTLLEASAVATMDISMPAASQRSIFANKTRLVTVLGVVAVISSIGIFLPNMAAAAEASSGSNVVSSLISFVLHLDKHLSALIQQYGTATYAILWAIVFCETGLVVTPFLPGDSLLFATGAFAGMGVLNLPALIGTLLTAAILGDAVNYAIGNKLGSWLTQRGMVNPRHIQQTEEFYKKYGGKTIVLARFLPIVRTFAPFVAGVGNMNYGRFAMYNVAGALIWTLGFCGAGFFFGNLPAVKHNFTLVVLGIIVVSCLPVVWELYNASRSSSKSPESGTGTSTA